MYRDVSLISLISLITLITLITIDVNKGKYKFVPGEGLEPPTYGL
jgi:hypothetical protein